MSAHAGTGKVDVDGHAEDSKVAKAIRKLQHPVRSRKLTGFLDGSWPDEAKEQESV